MYLNYIFGSLLLHFCGLLPYDSIMPTVIVSDLHYWPVFQIIMISKLKNCYI